MVQKFNPKKTLEYELMVGDSLSLKDSLFGGTFYLGYAGMPSKDIFSIINYHKSIGYGENLNESLNLFYPASQREINAYSNYFEVLSVDAEKIKLKYSGEK